MDIDTDRWRRLLDDYRDAREDGPNFVDVQTAIERKQRAPAALDSFKRPACRATPRPRPWAAPAVAPDPAGGRGLRSGRCAAGPRQQPA